MNQTKSSGIYKIENTVNGKFYIGSSYNLHKRYRQHLLALRNGRHINSKLQSSWSKHGESSFIFSVIELVLDISLLIKTEQLWIDRSNPEFNLARFAGSTLGVIPSEEVRKKMSDSARLRPVISDETRGLIGASSRGKVLSAETKNKIGNKNRGKKASDETRLKIGRASVGRKATEETRIKISKSGLGRVVSEQTRLKISNSHMGKIQASTSLATRQKLSVAAKGKPKNYTPEMKAQIAAAFQKTIANRRLIKQESANDPAA